MSRGKQLNEMDGGTKQSRTAVNAHARPGEGMSHVDNVTPGQPGRWVDLGGPTPENYRNDDDSAKISETPLKSVSDAVTRHAKAADPMPKLASVKEATEEDSEEDDSEETETPGQGKSEKKDKKGKGKDEDKKEDEVKESVDEDDYEDEEGEEEVEYEEVEEEEEVQEEEFDIEEDVNALLEGEALSEDFQEKARTIFEAALRSKVSDIRESLEVKYEQRLLEEVEVIKEDLQERVDAYLEYVAQEWMTENALSVERGLKEELSESFLGGLKELFEEHYVAIPEERYDVLESMVEKLDDMEQKLNEQIDKNIQMNRRLSESVAGRVFNHVSEGLAATQREKLASLAESVEFEGEDQYREKLEVLREAYFPTNRTVSTQPETLTEGFYAGEQETYSDTMATYMRTLSMLGNK
jgi:hypothetical protein